MVIPAHHKLSDKYLLTHTIKSKAANVYIYNKCLAVVEVHEGVTLSYLTGASLLIRALFIFKNRKWAYISNRINSYSVVPTDYDHLHKIGSLKVLSIVRNPQEVNKALPIESIFCRKPLKLFNELDEALDWSFYSLNELRKLEKNTS